MLKRGSIVFYSLVLLAFMWVFSEPLYGEPKKSNGKKKAFSQLYFDRQLSRSKDVKKGPLSPSEVLRLGVETKEQEESSAKFLNKNSSGLAFHVRDDIEEDEALIVPKLRVGPLADKSNDSAITSKTIWQRGGSKSCRSPQKVADVCLQAAALKEVLSRYTGSEDFYQLHCSEQCESSDEEMRAVSFKISKEDESKYNFNILDEVRECKYQWSKPRSSRWGLQYLSSVTCTCLPKNCLKQSRS